MGSSKVAGSILTPNPESEIENRDYVKPLSLLLIQKILIFEIFLALKKECGWAVRLGRCGLSAHFGFENRQKSMFRPEVEGIFWAAIFWPMPWFVKIRRAGPGNWSYYAMASELFRHPHSSPTYTYPNLTS